MVLAGGSYSASIAEHVRSILRRNGESYPAACVVDASEPGDRLAGVLPNAKLVFLVVSESVDSSTAAVLGMQAATDCPIIAVGAARDAKDVVRLIRAGAADFLCVDEDLAEEIDAAMRRVTGGEDSRSCGRIVTVTAATGGAGCSVIASNLAAVLAKKVGHCLLCDMQLHLKRDRLFSRRVDGRGTGD